MRRFGYTVCALAAASLITTPVSAEKARDLRYIVGMKEGPADRALRNEGFRRESTDRYNNYRRAYWWQDKGDNCVVVNVGRNNDRVTAIYDADKKDCGHSGGIDTGEALAIGAGVVAIGALLAGASSGGDKDAKAESESAPAPAPATEPAPSQPAPAAQPAATPAQFSDLTGMTTGNADAMLRQRGFDNVEAFRSSADSHTIWWRAASLQCVEMVTSAGVVKTIAASQHPDCK